MRSVRFAQDFGSGLPLRSRPLIASTYEIRSLRSGFRQRAPASLTPANRLNLTENGLATLPIWEPVEASGCYLDFQRALANGSRAASSSVSGDGHSSALANRVSFLRMARGMSVMAITGWM